jgi:hypothetical protein
MSTTPEPIDDSYPESWKPRYVKEREAANRPPDIERELLGMDPLERVALLRRIGVIR